MASVSPMPIILSHMIPIMLTVFNNDHHFEFVKILCLSYEVQFKLNRFFFQYLQKMQLRLESKFSENMKYYGTEKAPKSLESSNGSNEQVQFNTPCVLVIFL
jgi:hypothetical protein